MIRKSSDYTTNCSSSFYDIQQVVPSVSKQFFQGIPGCILPTDLAWAADGLLEGALGEIEVFTVIGAVLLLHGLRPAFAALVGNSEIMMDAVAATTEVGFAIITFVSSAGGGGEGPFTAAVEAMFGHADILPRARG